MTVATYDHVKRFEIKSEKRVKSTSPVKLSETFEGRHTGLILEENETWEARRRIEKSLL